MCFLTIFLFVIVETPRRPATRALIIIIVRIYDIDRTSEIKRRKRTCIVIIFFLSFFSFSLSRKRIRCSDRLRVFCCMYLWRLQEVLSVPSCRLLKISIPEKSKTDFQICILKRFFRGGGREGCWPVESFTTNSDLFAGVIESGQVGLIAFKPYYTTFRKCVKIRVCTAAKKYLVIKCLRLIAVPLKCRFYV